MTCREKLKIEHPEKVDHDAWGGCSGCPHIYGYLPAPDYCSDDSMRPNERCTKCWDRVIPGTEETKEEVNMDKDIYTFYTCTEINKMSDFEKNGLIARLQTAFYATKTTNEELTKILAARESEIEKLKKEKDIMNLDGGRLNDEIDRLNAAVADYKRRIWQEQELSNKVEELKKENEKLKGDIERWNRSYAYLVEQNKTLKKKLEASELCYRGRIVQCDELAEKVKRLEHEIDELNHAINLKNKDLEDKDGYIKHLLERIDEQRKKIDELENGDVLPYFVRKLITADAVTNAIYKCPKLPDEPYCKSVPCSEAIKQLENKVDDIPCIKAKNGIDDAINDYIMKSPKPVCWDDYWPINHLGKWNITDPSYDKTATHMMRKYKALRNAGFDHDDAMSLIPVWLDE